MRRRRFIKNILLPLLLLICFGSVLLIMVSSNNNKNENFSVTHPNLDLGNFLSVYYDELLTATLNKRDFIFDGKSTKTPMIFIENLDSFISYDEALTVTQLLNKHLYFLLNTNVNGILMLFNYNLIVLCKR